MIDYILQVSQCYHFPMLTMCVLSEGCGQSYDSFHPVAAKKKKKKRCHLTMVWTSQMDEIFFFLLSLDVSQLLEYRTKTKGLKATIKTTQCALKSTHSVCISLLFTLWTHHLQLSLHYKYTMIWYLNYWIFKILIFKILNKLLLEVIQPSGPPKQMYTTDTCSSSVKLCGRMAVIGVKAIRQFFRNMLAFSCLGKRGEDAPLLKKNKQRKRVVEKYGL